MFRLLLKLGIVVAIISMAVFYYFPLSRGQIPESPLDRISIVSSRIWNKIKNTDLSLPELPQATPASTGPVTLYRWQDTAGQWHFSNTPPVVTENTRNYTSLLVNPDTNLIQGIEPADQKNDDTPQTSPPTKTPADKMPANPYSKEAIKQLFKQAEAIRDNSQKRQKIMQNLDQ